MNCTPGDRHPERQDLVADSMQWLKTQRGDDGPERGGDKTERKPNHKGELRKSDGEEKQR